ncbi:hypothetical protein RSSM_03943 [Rhodopirellula sallentina SM41]|uniref:Uncharacterized protein n=1 Tax=Rhodopirellula sallentina SM41 TaxID=1263870 RepID=M5U9T6_9BACT|nr:hypothetical protein RSSM_03943 [Rhodopirellula sallentina SM41]
MRAIHNDAQNVKKAASCASFRAFASGLAGLLTQSICSESTQT